MKILFVCMEMCRTHSLLYEERSHTNTSLPTLLNVIVTSFRVDGNVWPSFETITT